ncbi:hypothetical protein C8R42DRAFT_733944 [Lentinula raphanica]|nr:hypothetical protein C8R42DRAFT_733944 [Lentinula raphanica]
MSSDFTGMATIALQRLMAMIWTEGSSRDAMLGLVGRMFEVPQIVHSNLLSLVIPRAFRSVGFTFDVPQIQFIIPAKVFNFIAHVGYKARFATGGACDAHWAGLRPRKQQGSPSVLTFREDTDSARQDFDETFEYEELSKNTQGRLLNVVRLHPLSYRCALGVSPNSHVDGNSTPGGGTPRHRYSRSVLMGDMSHLWAGQDQTTVPSPGGATSNISSSFTGPSSLSVNGTGLPSSSPRRIGNGTPGSFTSASERLATDEYYPYTGSGSPGSAAVGRIGNMGGMGGLNLSNARAAEAVTSMHNIWASP